MNRNTYVYSVLSSADLNSLVGSEKHVFIVNGVNSPFYHGFLDVNYFDGSLFAPSGAGATPVSLQVFYRYDTGDVYRRTYNHLTGTFSNWVGDSTWSNFPNNDFFTTANLKVGEYSIYGDFYANPPYSGLVAGRLSVKLNTTDNCWFEFRPWNDTTIYYLNLSNSTWSGWKKLTPVSY